MGLALYYKEDDVFVEVSTGTERTAPVITTHDGKPGDLKTVQLYVRNDDATKWYSNIRVRPVDLIGADPYGDVAYSETGWGVKLNAGSDEPTSGEWDDLSWGNEIQISNLGADGGADTTTYSPLWYLISCPPNTDAIIKTDIVMNVAYTENSVS